VLAILIFASLKVSVFKGVGSMQDRRHAPAGSTVAFATRQIEDACTAPTTAPKVVPWLDKGSREAGDSAANV